MAVIETKASYVPNGPVRRLTAADWRKIDARRAKELPEVKTRYAALATAIKSVATTFLRHEMSFGLVIGTKAKHLEVIVYSPEDNESVSGVSEWHIYYGDGAWAGYNLESYPADMSAGDIATRVDFLVTIVNNYPRALGLKYKRQMKRITDRIIYRSEMTMTDGERAEYAQHLASQASAVAKRPRPAKANGVGRGKPRVK